MAEQDEVVDSPRGWVAQHIRTYVESGGEKGHHWRGTQTALLTTRGRKSGKLRRTPLIYGQDGDRYLLVASLGGADHHPLWYLNLVADPKVTLQVGADVFTGRARTASPEEKQALWPVMVGLWPDYDQYQAKTDRDIPVVIITRD
jgi:deazaflavin-dependent oxidoreductase (nitroreductase family)